MEERCIVCGEVIPEGRQVCPICNREYDDPPALSREDNKTLICPECGTMQALDDARGLIGRDMSDNEWETYKKTIIKMMKAKEE